MDRLLKELESLKGEKKDSPKPDGPPKVVLTGDGLAVASSNQYSESHFLIH